MKVQPAILILLVVFACGCDGKGGDSKGAPGGSGDSEETGEPGGTGDTRADSGSDSDGGTDSSLDTGDTGPAELSGRLFECGEWETQAAPSGAVLLRDASATLDFSQIVHLNSGIAADIDGDGCTEMAFCRSDSPCVFLPGTIAETILVEERQRATMTGEEWHLADVISIGDLDADGQRDDWVIGASGLSSGSDDGFTGAVYVFPEPLSGDYTEADASVTIWPPEESPIFVQAQDIGDTNADGLDELAIGWCYEVGGRCRVVTLSSPLQSGSVESDHVASIETDEGRAFAHYLTLESDLDADGSDDLVVTSYSWDGYTGAVYLYRGPVTGSMVIEDADRTLIGEHGNSLTGDGVSGGADANGDGYEDLLIPAHGAGKVYLVLGPIHEDETLADAHAVFTGGGELGNSDSLSLPQDLDADGFPDPVIGDNEWHELADDPRGAFFLFYGPVSGTHDVADADAIFYEDDEDWYGGDLGGFVTGLGDTDGDGYDDLLLGTWGNGPAWLFRGGPR